MLKISNLTKTYRQRGVVLDNLDLELSEGETVSITGPSGSGKTTLLNIIGLLDKPDNGTILFRGNNILSYNQESSAVYRNRDIGFVFQDHLLLPYLTVWENILLPLIPSKLDDKEYGDRTKYAGELMKQTGIQDLANKYPYGISVGEAQRTALVRAVINRPHLLLADEPTGALDKKNADNLGDLLLKLNKDHGIGLLIVTHSEELAGKMGTRLRLNEGKLLNSR
jgi:lipoprotein-releasing system ATP-binding protein